MDGLLKFKVQNEQLEEATHAVCEIVRGAGGRALLVGGCVRDTALDFPAKDIDIEVYGIAPARLEELLSKQFKIDRVGQTFGVLMLQGLPIDISIPRRESKVGLGHKGFEIFSDPFMSVEEAAHRRDFTMNAMALDPLTGELLDPYDGLSDIKNNLLRHTSEKFGEDPLRVLRGMQFAARFDLDVAPETVQLCQSIEPEGLARERIFEEWSKLLLKGIKPSKGLSFLRACGWIQYFPELQALIGCEQDPQWHPEGDVWTHTLHCMDAFAQERIGEMWEDLVVGFAVLCHDLGKPATTVFEAERIRSKGHAQAGEAPTRTFMARLSNQEGLINAIVPLVQQHMRPVEFHKAQAGPSAIRRLAIKVARIDRLVRLARADQQGRPSLPFDGFPAGDWLLERARELSIERSEPNPIVMGHHLIELGLNPGPHFGPILETCFQAQLEGEISTVEEGIALVKNIVNSETC